MKKTLVLAVSTACLLAALSARANLIQNGGFESGDLGPWWVNAFAPHPVAVVNHDQHSGDYCLEMLSPPPQGGSSGVYQDVSVAVIPLTLVAAPTTVDFWIKTSGPGLFQAFLDSQVLIPDATITGATGYTEYTYTVIPEAGVDELNFNWLSEPAGDGSPHALYLDDVSVTQDLTPVPEPTTIIAGALLLLPFGASTLRILRRKA